MLKRLSHSPPADAPSAKSYRVLQACGPGGADSGGLQTGLRADFRATAGRPDSDNATVARWRLAAGRCRDAALAVVSRVVWRVVGPMVRRVLRAAQLSLFIIGALLFGYATTGKPVPLFAPGPPADPPPPAAAVVTVSSLGASRYTEPIGPSFARKTTTLRRGGTLVEALVAAGAARAEAYGAVTAMGKVYDLRRVRAGQAVELTFEGPDPGAGGAPGGRTLSEVAFAPAPDRRVVVHRAAGDAFAAENIQARLERRLVRANGEISDSLFLSARRARVPAAVIVAAIKAFSYDVDFQREVRAGDRFDLFFENFTDQAGAAVKSGHILYAALTLSGRKLELYRYRPADDGVADFFNAAGHSARKALLRTPVDGARLTSRFGTRRHPILGYRRMHQGVDFGARRGTPVMAAGNGTVTSAGRNGAYGNYIRIRHDDIYATAYAHLSRFARGLKRGKRVKQGQVIGFVGSTGRSTGPHLHYEVFASGRRVNPLSLRLPTGRRLKGKLLDDFRVHAARLDAQMAASAPATLMAAAP